MHADYFANEQSYLKMSPALVAKYQDKWIAVVDGKIVASGDGGVRPVFEAAAQIHKHPYLVRAGSDVDRYAVDRATVFRVALYQADVPAMRQYAAEEPHLFEKLRIRKERIVHDAAKHNSPEAVRALIELGADINEQDANGYTGLVWAVTYERAEVARTLLELGADPNLGCPVFSVASSQHLEDRVAMAKLLVEHGADINQPFLVEHLPPRTVLSEAIGRRHMALVDFLKSCGAKLPEKASGKSKRAACTAPGDYTADLISHFRKYYGKPDERVFRDIVPASNYPILVHYIRLAKKQDCSVLFTSGLSRVDLRVPAGAEHYQRAELVMDMHKNWPGPDEILKDRRWAWPIQWMRKIATYAAESGEWLGAGFTTFAAEDPPKPLAPGLKFTAWLLASLSSDDTVVQCQDGTKIQMYQVFPLYNEEYVFARMKGTDALMSLFVKHDIQTSVDLSRPNVAVRS
ncbi:MAG TPA: suppressor of fused domain protein [Pirellulales bacterium]